VFLKVIVLSFGKKKPQDKQQQHPQGQQQQQSQGDFS